MMANRKTGTEENPNAGRQDAAAVLGTSNVAVPGTAVKPPLQLKRSPRVEGTSVADQALSLMGGVTGAVEKGLAANGLKITSMAGDVIINGKKLDMDSSKTTAKINSVPRTIPQGSGAYSGSTFVHPSTLSAAGATQISGTSSNGRPSATWIGVEFLDKDGKKWKVVGDAGGAGLSVKPVKAGYGTMKLNPKVPTIVGDRGPEMAFGGMIIPNMAKVPYASTQVINASPGMNEDQLITKAKIAAYEFLQSSIKSNAKMVGTPMNVSIKRT